MGVGKNSRFFHALASHKVVREVIMSSTQHENTVYEEQLDEAFWSNIFKQEAKHAPPAETKQAWPLSGNIPIFNDPGAENSTSWRLAQEALRSDRVLELRVTGFNKGGLLVYWQDLQGFVPASQLVNFPLLHDTRPAHHVEGVDGAGCGKLRGHLLDAPADQFDELGIDLQFRLPIESAAKIQRTFDLATIEFCGDRLPECLLVRTHFLREPELHVEITMVDGAYFPGQCAYFRVGRFARKACHTV